MLKDVIVTVAVVLVGVVAGIALKALRGNRWRNSIRGMLFATALIAIALYLIVSSMRD